MEDKNNKVICVKCKWYSKGYCTRLAKIVTGISQRDCETFKARK